jgi:polysaccharide deacetylase family protein (PEP-CTERM system associated)
MRTSARRGELPVASGDARPDAMAPGGALARLWSGSGSPANALTCDVEDYFQVSAFENVVSKAQWDNLECRLPRNVDRLLQLLSDAGVNGTFFTLGWVAERLPAVVRRIADAGHEVASHGMRHVRVWNQQPEEFLADVARAKRLLEDVSGTPVLGYRAASWSFDSRTPWMHRILEEAGYEYSSSVYPIAHDHYGVPDAPVVPFYSPSTRILEIPASTVRLLGRNWPAAGGGYFRLLPLPVSLWLLRRARRTLESPALFYFHPWEIDPGQPRIAGAGAKARFRHYLNLDKMETRLKVLLGALRWDRVDRIFCRPENRADLGAHTS